MRAMFSGMVCTAEASPTCPAPPAYWVVSLSEGFTNVRAISMLDTDCLVATLWDEAPVTGPYTDPGRCYVKLTLGRIVEAALTIQNAEGLDAVTTRRLAQVLKVTSPAMYRHVGSKEELLGHMIAAILAEAMTAMSPCKRWQEWLEQYAHTFRDAFLRYRDSARMMLIAAPSDRTRLELVPAVYQPLMAWGLSETDAVVAEGAMASFVLGWVGYEQNPRLRPILAKMFDLDQQFARSAQLLIAGLETGVRVPIDA